MKAILFITIGAFICLQAPAQADGPRSGSIFNDVYIPGAEQPWLNLENAAISDDIYTNFNNITGPTGTFTDYLVATGFNFQIPSGATIQGILVKVECSDPNLRTSDYSVRIVKLGSIGATEMALGSAYPQYDKSIVYGSSSDLWGETWNYKEINDSTFGVAVSAQRNAADDITAGQIDDINITVYYSLMTLPLTLNSFTVTRDNKTVLVNWNTSNEINMDHFTVERSADGRNFTSLGNIPSNNQSTASYSFRDYSPLAGHSYYRLRMEEISGNAKYSRVALISFNKSDLVTLSPSPWTRGNNLFISNPTHEQLAIQFYTSGGQMIGETSTSSGQVNMPALGGTRGIIFFKVTDKNNLLKGTGSLMVY